MHAKEVEKATVGSGWVSAAKKPTLAATLLTENELLRAALRFYASGGKDEGRRAQSALKPQPEDAHHFSVTGEYHARLTAAQCEVLRAVFETAGARWRETAQP